MSATGTLDRVVSSGAPAHEPPGPPRRAGTPLDVPPHPQQTGLPGWRAGLAIFTVAAAAYIAFGYWFTIELRVVVFDAVERLSRAYLVWHNAPPKLAAIGFDFAPLTTLVHLPFATVKPLASSLVALPVMSGVFAALTLVMVDRTLARCDMTLAPRLVVLAAFAVNPLWAFYAGNGMSEVVYTALLAFTLYCFVAWYGTTMPRYLFGAGVGVALLVVTRYSFIVWALLLGALIALALRRHRASLVEVEGSLVAYAAPAVYVLSLWALFSGLIIGDPFGWLLHDVLSHEAINAAGADTEGPLALTEVGGRLLELSVAVSPLGLAAVPALAALFVARRNHLALWLAVFLGLGAAIVGTHAYLAQNEGLLTLRDSFPMLIAGVVGAGWVYRSVDRARPAVWAATVALLVVGLFTSWAGMQHYPFQGQEQAFARAVSTGERQEGRTSLSGYTVGVDAEAQMAEHIKRAVPEDARNAVLADNAQTYAVMLLTGRPGVFLDRVDVGDTRWRQILEDPVGHVRYLLVATDPRTGDLIGRRYPGAVSGPMPGLRTVARTGRYALLRVPPPATAPGQQR